MSDAEMFGHPLLKNAQMLALCERAALKDGLQFRADLCKLWQDGTDDCADVNDGMVADKSAATDGAVLAEHHALTDPCTRRNVCHLRDGVGKWEFARLCPFDHLAAGLRKTRCADDCDLTAVNAFKP